MNFEKDVGLEASKTSSELAAIELEIQRTNNDISAMENQMSEAQTYHKQVIFLTGSCLYFMVYDICASGWSVDLQIQMETQDMEQQVKDLAAEDTALSSEAHDVQTSLKSLESAIAQGEGEYLRHKAQAEKELAMSECTYGKELEQKDQQVIKLGKSNEHNKIIVSH